MARSRMPPSACFAADHHARRALVNHARRAYNLVMMVHPRLPRRLLLTGIGGMALTARPSHADPPALEQAAARFWDLWLDSIL